MGFVLGFTVARLTRASLPTARAQAAAVALSVSARSVARATATKKIAACNKQLKLLESDGVHD